MNSHIQNYLGIAGKWRIISTIYD